MRNVALLQRRPTMLWLLLLPNLFIAAALEVNSGSPLMLSLIESDAILHCQFVTSGSVKVEDVAVMWTVKTNSGMRSVFTFDGAHSESHRPGAYVDLRHLTQGNASLRLSAAKIEDEGLYTCTVLISPEFGSGTIELKISAQPLVNISPLNPVMTEGEEKTFFCDVQKFYPQEIDISWLVEKDNYQQLLKKDICTGIPTADSNGTFSSSSRITLVVSKEDEWASYICQVTHQSLAQPLRRNSTIHLTRAQLHQTRKYVITVTSVSVLVTGVCTVFFTLLYQRRFSQVPPMISSIIMPDWITANKKVTLICNVNGFRPKPIIIRWHIGKENSHEYNDASEESAFLMTRPLQDITEQAEQPLMKQGQLFGVMSSLCFTPKVEDDGVTFLCSVEHKALKKTELKSATMRVTVQPSCHYITSWPRVPVEGEKLTLTCMIEKFYPKAIGLKWFKNNRALTNATQFGPFPCERSLFSVWSQVELILTKDDEGMVYTCQIKHCSLEKVEELSYEVNLKGTPPEVLWIKSDPDPPMLGEELKMSCKINNFSPDVITVKWLRNGQILHNGICNSLSAVNANGLHCMWSVLQFVPAREDQGSLFVCKVEHVASKTCEERTYHLHLAGFHVGGNLTNVAAIRCTSIE